MIHHRCASKRTSPRSIAPVNFITRSFRFRSGNKSKQQQQQQQQQQQNKSQEDCGEKLKNAVDDEQFVVITSDVAKDPRVVKCVIFLYTKFC